MYILWKMHSYEVVGIHDTPQTAAAAATRLVDGPEPLTVCINKCDLTLAMTLMYSDAPQEVHWFIEPGTQIARLHP